MSLNQLSDIFIAQFGTCPDTVLPLAGSGSNRRYYRLAAGSDTAIGCIGTSEEENSRFIRYDRFFHGNGINVPYIYGVSGSGMEYLMQDLGDSSLFGMLHTAEGERLVEETMRDLARLQTLSGTDDLVAGQRAEFSRRMVMFDLNYFKYEFLKPLATEFDEYALQDDFEKLAEELADYPEEMSGFMYRDCQSRNVMIREGKPWWIDFQGGMRGPCVYDAASLLWQAKAGFSDAFRKRMTDVYLDSISIYRKIDTRLWREYIDRMAAFRTLQVLGAYGFRGLVEKKSHFIESIPPALGNLASLTDHFEKYPELSRVVRSLAKARKFDKKDNGGRLCVNVFSFSYKKGYPDDFSGNGGGFMFDCRGMHNPGRYDEYKTLTGLDQPVIEFLEKRGEVQRFVGELLPPVERTVSRYLDRGFTSLQIGFGCTGGRHRSVYCAEMAARILAGKFPQAIIKLTHREQDIQKTYNA